MVSVVGYSVPNTPPKHGSSLLSLAAACVSVLFMCTVTGALYWFTRNLSDTQRDQQPAVAWLLAWSEGSGYSLGNPRNKIFSCCIVYLVAKLEKAFSCDT